MIHNSSANFKLIHFRLWTKGPHQNPNFDTFKCSGENFSNFSCRFSNHKSVFLQVLHLFIVMKDNSSVLLYLKQYIRWSEGAHLKCKFWRLSSARVKIRPIPHVNFKMTNQFFFNFCIILHCHDT